MGMTQYLILNQNIYDYEVKTMSEVKAYKHKIVKSIIDSNPSIGQSVYSIRMKLKFEIIIEDNFTFTKSLAYFLASSTIK